jgi:hypothetical protein
MKARLMSFSGLGAAALAALVFAGCEIIAPEERQLGYLGETTFGFGISVPDTVALGASFQVNIPVFGSGSCTVVDEVEVDYLFGGAALRPFVISKGRVCTSDLRRFIATGTVTLDRPGLSQLWIHGRYGTLDAMSRHTERDTTVVRHTFVR